MWANVCLLVWEAKGDRAAGEHHQRERGLGGVEPVGAPGDEPHLVVERVNPSVVDAKADRGEDALTVGADGAGEFDERFQPAAGGLDAPAVEQLGRLAGGEVAGDDRPSGLLEPIGAPGRTAVAAQLAQGGGLGVGQTLGALEQHPAGAFELLGLVRVHSAQLVPDLSADLIERVAGEGDDVERVDAHGRVGGVARLGHRLQVGRSHVSGDGGKLGCAVGAQLGEEQVAGGGVLALGAPHHLAGAMVGDQGEVAVPLTPGHLVDADLEQLLQPARVELVGDHPGTDRPDRLPGDPHQPEAAKVQVPPAGVDRAGVVAGPAGVGAVRAGEPAAAQRDRDGDLRRLERDVAHRGTRKGEQAVECSSDAHGRWTSGLGLGHLQPYGLACARHPSRSQHLVGVVLPASPSAKDPRRTHIQFRSPIFPRITHLPVAGDVAKLSAANQSLLLAFSAILLGLLLSALQTPLYRILEGYYLPERLRDRWIDTQRQRKQIIQENLKARRKARAALQGAGGAPPGARTDDSRRPPKEVNTDLLFARLLRYPVDARPIAPTRFANGIRASETYGYDRFWLDSQALWTELLSVVPETVRTEQDRARAGVDFFVSLVYLFE